MFFKSDIFDKTCFRNTTIILDANALSTEVIFKSTDTCTHPWPLVDRGWYLQNLFTNFLRSLS